MQGVTLTSEINQASMVLFGTLENPDQKPNMIDGTVDLVIEKSVKPHEILEKAAQKKADGTKYVTLSRYVPVDLKKKFKWVVFCDVFKGKIDPYRGMQVADGSDPSKYLLGAVAVKDTPMNERLKFFFEYLDDPNPEISGDALKEFGNADYKDYKDMAKGLPADKIAGWLQDPKTPTYRYGLYASLLGHCGSDKHAKILRKMLDDPERKLSSGVDGMMAGYVMLRRQEGWEFLCSILKDPKKDFTTRYAALRTARFFHEFRTDLVSTKDAVGGVAILLNQPDIADLAIEDLRKWQCWDLADRILALKDNKEFNIPILKRSILRFALSCPKEAAKAYVADRRQHDPDAVTNAEELLKLESTPPTPTRTVQPRGPGSAGKSTK